MPEDARLAELAGLIMELRSIAEDLRATAVSLARVRTDGPSGEAESARELARRALPELQRASRRGHDGGRMT